MSHNKHNLVCFLGTMDELMELKVLCFNKYIFKLINDTFYFISF